MQLPIMHVSVRLAFLMSVFFGPTLLSATVVEVESKSPPAFRESAAQLGVDFVHWNGMSGKLYTPEVMGPGIALFDYDNDGDLDLYLGQGARLDESVGESSAGGSNVNEPFVFPPPAGVVSDRLYRNDLEVSASGESRLHFTDVTRASGLEAATGYNIGVATGDFDNDGFVDVYLTNLGGNHLFRNRGDGTFVDVIQSAGVDDRRFSVPAVFFDYDLDGWLDLFVGNYHRFRPGTPKKCFRPNGLPDYCGPLSWPAEPDRLLHNQRDGTFQDTTLAAGLGDEPATALGAVAADFDGDGLPDLYVANDMMANRLWINRGDGTFSDEALLRGVAFDGDGKAQASMGVVAEDLDGDGSIDLFMSHLEREYNTLYLNDGTGLFMDRTRQSGLVEGSWAMTGFGTVVLDYDGDGIDDLFVVNGAIHLLPDQLRRHDPHPLAMENQLFRGLGGGRFEEVDAREREDPVLIEVSRGLARGDLDNDGDSDLVISNNAGPTRVLINQRPQGIPWLGLRLTDEAGGSDVFGARARVEGSKQKGGRRVHTDGSYGAANDPRLLFVLDDTAPRAVVVEWPGGGEERFEGVRPGRYSTLRRGDGKPVSPDASPEVP